MEAAELGKAGKAAELGKAELGKAAVGKAELGKAAEAEAEAEAGAEAEAVAEARALSHEPDAVERLRRLARTLPVAAVQRIVREARRTEAPKDP